LCKTKNSNSNSNKVKGLVQTYGCRGECAVGCSEVAPEIPLSRVKGAASPNGHPSIIPETPQPKISPPQLDSTPSPPASTIPTQPFTMAALATKTQSQNIFTKLKSKPANKVRCSQTMPNPDLTHVDMLRLRRKEPNMELCSLWHLPMSRLLVQPP